MTPDDEIWLFWTCRYNTRHIKSWTSVYYDLWASHNPGDWLCKIKSNILMEIFALIELHGSIYDYYWITYNYELLSTNSLNHCLEFLWKGFDKNEFRNLIPTRIRKSVYVGHCQEHITQTNMHLFPEKFIAVALMILVLLKGTNRFWI